MGTTHTTSMRILQAVLLIASFIAPHRIALAQAGHLTAAEAKKHVGETATVCGKVASTHVADKSRGQPTFLNLDEPYPKETFTILIWGSDRPKFGHPEVTYRDKDVCVTGKITSHGGIPEIVASEPSQIQLRK